MSETGLLVTVGFIDPGNAKQNKDKTYGRGWSKGS